MFFTSKMSRADFSGGSVLALGVAILTVSVPAVAQTDAGSDTPEEIVITGSRIVSSGFDAPTPMTVVGEDELRQAGRTDISETLADLPQFRRTQSATSTNTVTSSGQSPADLRGLGNARTLVLINSRRYVSSNDLQTVPYSLVKNIEIVTGGASAAYGSGAVAGVVNLILDDELEGFELGAQTGISSRGDGKKSLFEASAGLNFADGRGHFMIGGDYLKDEGVIPGNARPLIGSALFFPGEDGQLYPTADVRDAVRNETGLINTGVLAGQTFNNDGTLRPFQYGIRRPGAPTLMQGGEGYNIDQFRSLSAPIERANVFGRVSYEVSDNLEIWAEMGFNEVSDRRVYFPDLAINQITVSATNPYLNQNIRSQLAAAGETEFTFGRAVTDVSLTEYDFTRQTFQGTVGLDGNFADGTWRYNVYYSHGEQEQDQTLIGLTLRENFFSAVDAVRDPISGEIVCRVALTNPGTDCRPLNLFGSGNATAAAQDYVTDNWNAVTTNWLDSAGASVSGDLFNLWDEPVAFAAGVEYREESFETLYDANSLAGNFTTINGVNIEKTGNNVKEGFVEVAAPILVGLPFAQRVTLNGAARVSDYSTSGSIWSWKVGGVWEVSDDIKFRATRSRDIRAASLNELFSNQSTFFTNVVDEGQGDKPTRQIILYTGGNPDLAPEIANTLTAGVVLTPQFMPGFAFSVDYYDIEIEDVITTLNAQQIVNSCYLQGNDAACAQISRGSSGDISEITATFINVAEFKNTGLDFEASYRTSTDGVGIPGQLDLRALANYVDRLETDNGIITIDGSGFLGSQAPFLAPKWRGTLTATFESDHIGLDTRVRYIDGGGYAPAEVLANIGDNDISSRTYVDLGVRAYVPFGDGDRFTVFGNVQNLFDRDPPLAAVSSAYFDLIGRYYTFGVRANF
jgi:outer membrane receptor protein involved in Fe transport|tara:strand:- start:279 stop:3014 length:2736 start_codon:yes stop_codon:yes gene_type:complete